MNYHFWSWNTAVDHFAAVHSQGDWDGHQSDMNDHTLSVEVGLGNLEEREVFRPSRIWLNKNKNDSMIFGDTVVSNCWMFLQSGFVRDEQEDEPRCYGR